MADGAHLIVPDFLPMVGVSLCVREPVPGLRFDMEAANDTTPTRTRGHMVKRLVPHFRLGRRARTRVV